MHDVRHLGLDNTGTDLDLPLLASFLKSATPDEVLLCYGLGEAHDSLYQLQQQLLDLLLARINKHCSGSAELLLVGDNLLRVANSLAGHSNSVVWLTTNEQQAQQANVTIEQVHSSFLDTDLVSRFDLILIEGTVHYLDQLFVLQQARKLLKEGGRLVLLGEYLANDSVIEFSPLANLESLRKLSQRLGYELQAETDLSAGAQLTLQKLLLLLRPHGTPEAKQIAASAMAIEDEFISGRRCLKLFEFAYRAVDADEWASAEFGAIDSFKAHDIATLFEKSFKVEFDAEVWDWKYRLGEGCCVVARTEPQGEIVSHYGGAPRKISYFGVPAMAVQVCDVMVLPEVRRNYGKSSLFFRTAATFLEREIGYSVAHLLGFGFPNQKAMHIATRLGLYEKTDDFVEAVCASDIEVVQGWRLEELNFEAQCDELDSLWQQMRDEFSEAIIGVRDSDYFAYRYLQHPFAKRGQYRCLQVLDAEHRLRAVAVVREHGEHNLLMELIAQQADMPPLVALLASWSVGPGNERPLKFWLTRNWLERLPLAVVAVNNLGIEIPCNSWNAGPPVEELRERWWLTAGDMDFL